MSVTNNMRFIEIILTIVIAFLVYGYICGPNGYHVNVEMQKKLEKEKMHTKMLEEKNDIIKKDIANLRDEDNLDTLENVARSNLNLIKEGEIFYQVIDNNEK